jgi:subtilisin family serine protease/Ca2+-binding RTX toxin-like protein
MQSEFNRSGEEPFATQNAANPPASGNPAGLDPAGNPVANPQFAANQIIIKFKAGVQSAEANLLRSSLGATVLEITQTLGAQLWQIEGIGVEEAIARFGEDPRIEYIEPNYTLSIESTLPNEPNFTQLWGLNNTGQDGGKPDADIDAPEAWDITTGSASEVVGVIDSGVDYTHPDLADNIWTNPGEVAGDGLDNDGNGYVDDIHGYDFANNDGDPMDDNSHGTHVAGTIAGRGNNSTGVTGVNWSSQIMGLKFLSASGSGTTFNAVRAVEYAAMMKQTYGVNINLTNNSWGGGGYSQALFDAIAASRNAGQLFIAAAGNSGLNTDISPQYPAGYNLDNIISVAATDRNDGIAGFSNYGATTVDLGAPGVTTYSTVPGNAYGNKSGTSMASPHVAGVAALLRSQYPELTAAQVKDLLLATVDPIAALQGKTVTGGRLNAYNALIAPTAGSLSGRKWNDADGDGTQDPDESGLANWTIYLDANTNGQLDTGETSVLTDANGNYTFKFVRPGTHAVAEVLQPGWTQTYPSSPGTYIVEVSENEDIANLDFGNQLTNPGTISGVKWNDIDRDGTQDEGEPGLANWTIYLDANKDGKLLPSETSTVTDSNGAYSFANLVPGTYTVAEVQQSGWEQTYPGTGMATLEPDDYTSGTLLNTVQPGVQLSAIGSGVSNSNVTALTSVYSSTGDRSFGNSLSSWYNNVAELRADFDAPTSTVSIDFISDDSSDIGVLEAYDSNNNLLATYTTAALTTGQSETMTITRSAGDIAYVLATGQDGFSVGYLDNLTFGEPDTHTVELEPDEVAANVNFGSAELEPVEIRGTKWLDLNGNGSRDADDRGLGGWTIYLDANNSGQLDEGETSTVTDGNGNYTFADLDAGTYTVAEVQQSGWTQTSPSSGSISQTLTFDDISNGTSFTPIPSNYGGLNWSSDFYYQNGTTVPNSGYFNGRVSGDYVAFNGFARSVTVTDDLFNLDSAYLTAAWIDGLSVRLQGFLDGVQQYDQTVVLDRDAPTFFNFDFDNIDQLQFTSMSGGTPNTQHFVLDNMTVSFGESNTHTVEVDSGEIANNIDFGNQFAANAIVGTDGNDSFLGTPNADLIRGLAGNDRIEGGFGTDLIDGGAGADTVYGSQDDDTVYGGADNDGVYGGQGSDRLYGESDRDWLQGGRSNDFLSGGNGIDTLVGVTPSDLNPGVGEIDTLQGDAGADLFMLGTVAKAFYNDGNNADSGLVDYAEIADFILGEDVIQLQGTVSNYVVAASPVGSANDAAIFRITPGVNELIGVAKNIAVADLVLASSSFAFV